MTFPTFPTLAGIVYPVKRTVKASTLRQAAISGRATFQPRWLYPLYDIEVSVSVLNAGSSPRGALAASEWQTFEDFWKTVMFAPGGVFKFSDQNDNAVSGNTFAEGDGTTTTFQLLRSLSTFAEPVLDPICGPNVPSVAWDYGSAASPAVPAGAPSDLGNCTVAPIAWLDYGYTATMQVFLGAYATQPTTPLAAWTFANGSADASGGVVEIATAPPSGTPLSWTGAYNWLCRFPNDMLDFSNFMFRLMALGKIAFETVRP